MENKEEFIKGIESSIRHACPMIEEINYKTDKCKEYVEITYYGETTDRISVTGDSEIAILYDISKFLML